MRQQNTQRGISLIDALIAMVVVAVGLIALVGFQHGLIATHTDSTARTEALNLAQAKLEELRNLIQERDFITTDANDNLVLGDALAASSEQLTGTNAAFTRSWTVTAADDVASQQYANVTTTVSWADVKGNADSLTLSSYIAWDDPAASLTADSPADLFTAGNAVLPPTGSGRLAEAGETPITDDGTNTTDNNDGTKSRSESDGDTTLTQLIIDNGGTDEVVFVSTKKFIKISGAVTADQGGDLDIIRVLASDAGYCQFNDGSDDSFGSLSEGSYNCYVAEDWYGNIGILGNLGNNKTCSAAIRFSSNSAVKGDPDYDTTHASARLAGELPGQNFLIRSGGCSVDETSNGEGTSPEDEDPPPTPTWPVTVSGSFSITAENVKNGSKTTVDDVKIGSDSCSLTEQGNKITAYQCSANAAGVVVNVSVVNSKGAITCTGNTFTVTQAINQTHDFSIHCTGS